MAPLARIVPKNWRLKIAALGLAVFLWTLVRTEPVTGVNLFTVPVHTQLDDVDWVLTDDPDPATVQVRLRGPSEDLIQLARTGTIVRIPLDSVSSGDTLVQLRRDWVVLEAGRGLVVEDIAPVAVRLTLQPSVSALLPLRVLMTGRLGGGVALAAPVSLDPQAVRVRGPAHRVRGLDSVRLEALDLGNLRRSGSYPVAVDTTGLGGLSVTPLVATIGLRLVWPEAGEQRCWNHKMRNVLDRLPQREQSEAKDLLRAVVYAPSRSEAVKAREVFARRYRPWYPKAVDVLEDDWERMVAFYDFPEDHWKHLRTTNVVESPFAAVRLRTTAAKRFKRVESATALIWKLLLVAEKRFRRLDAPHLLKDVFEGRKFEDGKPVSTQQRKNAA